MKRILIFTMSLLLLVSATGLTFTVHFCGDRIASLSSGFPDSVAQRSSGIESCCAKKAKADKGCCSEKLVKIKAKPEVVAKQEVKLDFTSPAVLAAPLFNSYLPVASPIHIFRYDCIPHGPPLYKLYNQFMLYA